MKEKRNYPQGNPLKGRRKKAFCVTKTWPGANKNLRDQRELESPNVTQRQKNTKTKNDEWCKSQASTTNAVSTNSKSKDKNVSNEHKGWVQGKELIRKKIRRCFGDIHFLFK